MESVQKWECDGCEKRYLNWEVPAVLIEGLVVDGVALRNARCCTKKCAADLLARRLEYKNVQLAQGAKVIGGFSALVEWKDYFLSDDGRALLTDEAPPAREDGAPIYPYRRVLAVSKTEVLAQ